MADVVTEQLREEFERARAAGKALAESPFMVVGAVYRDPPEDTLVLTLRNGVVMSIPHRLMEELDHVPPSLMRGVAVAPPGDGLYWEAIDVSISTDGLLAAMVGAIDARRTGRVGGSKKSARKTAAARENGKKGGRPRKAAQG